MLCKRPTKTIEGTVKEMRDSEFIIEEKLDGERMQLHKRGNEYFYCSRSFMPSVSIHRVSSLISQKGQGLHVLIRKASRRREFDPVYCSGIRPTR
jgi:hypothetical protein